MIIKQCQFSGKDDKGAYVHLVHPGQYNDHLIKEAQASPPQLEQARKIIYNAPKRNGHIYTFVSAMGAGEYWGSNSNGDDFPEEPLIHVPPGWNEMSHSRQRTAGKTWEWGYPTFYKAHAFQHHVNKDPARAFGTVYYAMWDSHMKRVLLILELSRAAAQRMGAQGVIDRIENGEFPDVSMGCKVPFDICSICADWERIIPLLGKPKKLLAEHKRKPIRGISVTRNDYCQHLRFEINKIYPDGRKVRMMNYHPNFFDISHVFIGADKTSKVMAKLAGERCPIRNNSPMCKKGCYTCGIPSSHVYEVWSRDMDKLAVGPSLARTLSPVLKGSVGGALVGGAGGAVTGASLDPDLETASDSALKGALIGAGSGALLGAGGGAAVGSKRIKSYVKHAPTRKLMAQSDKDLSTARNIAGQVDDALSKGEDPGVVDELKSTALKLKDKSELNRRAALDMSRDIMDKTSSEDAMLSSLFGINKKSELDLAKKAEIIKRIRSNFSNALPKMESEEPGIPKEILNMLARDLPDTLASAGSMGIIAKPKEFQRMILVSRGQPDLADGLDEHGLCFNPGAKPSSDQMVGKIIPKILELLSPLMGGRSALAPAVHKRIIRITIAKPMDRPKELPEELSDSPMLNKISADYSAYRQQLLHKYAALVNQLTHEHPVIISDLLGDLHINSLSGGLVKAGGDVMESVIGMFPIDYMNKAYLDNPVSEYMDTNCDLSSLVTIGDLASCGKVA